MCRSAGPAGTSSQPAPMTPAGVRPGAMFNQQRNRYELPGGSVAGMNALNAGQQQPQGNSFGGGNTMTNPQMQQNFLQSPQMQQIIQMLMQRGGALRMTRPAAVSVCSRGLGRQPGRHAAALRRALRGDARADGEAGRGRPRDEVASGRLQAIRRRRPDHQLHRAHRRGEPVGYCNAYLSNDMHNGEFIGVEDAVFVRKQHRNGVGKELIKFTIEDMRRRGVVRLHVDATADTRVEHLLKRMGFKPRTMCMVYSLKDAANVPI